MIPLYEYIASVSLFQYDRSYDFDKLRPMRIRRVDQR
jgi:hypothetical protein